MVGLTVLLNWATPHLMVDDFLGGWSLTRIMLLTILMEVILYGYDAIWVGIMLAVHHLLNILDRITHFPPIDFPEDKESEVF